MKKKFFKLLKILALSIFIMLISVPITLYLSLNENLPKGEISKEADIFALEIQKAVQHDKYLNTKFLQWTFRNKNHYIWNKKDNTVEVEFEGNKVYLDLNNSQKSKVLVSQNSSKKIIKKALDNFNNDSFWLVAPHKFFDKGTARRLVTLKDNSKGLLITYASGGTTPGDSYLWKVDENYRPISYKMWVSILPIGGIEATWEDWTTTKSGAYLSQQHKLLGFGIPITNLKAWND